MHSKLNFQHQSNKGLNLYENNKNLHFGYKDFTSKEDIVSPKDLIDIYINI